MFVRIADESDLEVLQAFDEWNEVTPARIAAGECAVAGADKGVIAYAVFDHSFLKERCLAFLYVHPDHRRRGFGAGLVEFVESEDMGEPLYISTGIKNAAMQNLLNQRGYRVAGMVDLEGHYEMVYVKVPGESEK